MKVFVKGSPGVDRKGRPFADQAQFERKGNESKYVPHIGAKEQAKWASKTIGGGSGD
jgi:hypothetical protein